MGAIREGKHIGRNAPVDDTNSVSENMSRHESAAGHTPNREEFKKLARK